jgi:hypothetical protein
MNLRQIDDTGKSTVRAKPTADQQGELLLNEINNGGVGQ